VPVTLKPVLTQVERANSGVANGVAKQVNRGCRADGPSQLEAANRSRVYIPNAYMNEPLYHFSAWLVNKPLSSLERISLSKMLWSGKLLVWLQQSPGHFGNNVHKLQVH
jgi:hypothetical protein